jgi:hypothetical protein
MIRSLMTMLALAAPAAAADSSGSAAWQPVAQTLVAVGLLVLLARGTEGEARDDRRKARGRGLMSSLSSGSW